ncbi:hypothetical protein TIFTF001_053030 [Ficus carica]|uniref:Uncharacterized protein n=1 Tax=Ficus carica TaxID=3494 RepID=A0AA88EF65_FICCA|nr:hypothetical protein TIFTF001_053030 [Ficus carica]
MRRFSKRAPPISSNVLTTTPIALLHPHSPPATAAIIEDDIVSELLVASILIFA